MLQFYALLLSYSPIILEVEIALIAGLLTIETPAIQDLYLACMTGMAQSYRNPPAIQTRIHTDTASFFQLWMCWQILGQHMHC